MGRRAEAGVPAYGMAVVRGDSMLPTLRPGDRLLVRYGARPRDGRVVLVRYADGVLAVKRAIERREHGWWVRGDASDEVAPGAVDSRYWGEIPDQDVLAVALLRLWPQPVRL
ncbi:S24/S26 family peptidase [Nocardioides montaniterrae]